jgi:hypothetical protein
VPKCRHPASLHPAAQFPMSLFADTDERWVEINAPERVGTF